MNEQTGEWGVACGLCGGSVYMETCGPNGGPDPDCTFAVAGECQSCGERNPFNCPDHPPHTGSEEADRG